MKIEITVGSRQVLIILLFIIAISAVGLVVAYGGSSPSTAGHSWGEVECNSCITSANIQDGTITSADISSIDGSKITGTVPSAQTLAGSSMISVYQMPAGCGGGLGTSQTCTTIICLAYSIYGGSNYYYSCAGACDLTITASQTCNTVYKGKILS
jgi:hypothetical protein